MAISSNQNHHTKSHTIPMRSYLTEAICFHILQGSKKLLIFCRLTRLTYFKLSVPNWASTRNFDTYRI